MPNNNRTLNCLRLVDEDHFRLRCKRIANGCQRRLIRTPPIAKRIFHQLGRGLQVNITNHENFYVVRRYFPRMKFLETFVV